MGAVRLVFYDLLYAVPQVREVASEASWRSNPLTSAEVIGRLILRHGCINRLLEAPWVKTDIFKMDWLHAADQGITADFIGNVFHHWVQNDVFPGSTKDDRYAQLWQEIQAWYEEEQVQDRLDALKKTFVEKRQGMKLRCSGAKCRALVPFVLKMCTELCDLQDPVEEAMYWAAWHLNRVYTTLSASYAEPAQAMQESSTQFALQYVALHDQLHGEDDKVWRIKPKLHFFLHLCSAGGRPAMHWCYRDEDFGGSVAKAARRRGGMRKPGPTSKRVLESMAIGTPRVSIR